MGFGGRREGGEGFVGGSLCSRYGNLVAMVIVLREREGRMRLGHDDIYNGRIVYIENTP